MDAFLLMPPLGLKLIKHFASDPVSSTALSTLNRSKTRTTSNLGYPDELQRALQHLAHRYLKLYCTVCLQFHQI